MSILKTKPAIDAGFSILAPAAPLLRPALTRRETKSAGPFFKKTILSYPPSDVETLFLWASAQMCWAGPTLKKGRRASKRPTPKDLIKEVCDGVLPRVRL